MRPVTKVRATSRGGSGRGACSRLNRGREFDGPRPESHSRGNRFRQHRSFDCGVGGRCWPVTVWPPRGRNGSGDVAEEELRARDEVERNLARASVGELAACAPVGRRSLMEQRPSRPRGQDQSCSDANRAPSAIAWNLAHVTLGCTVNCARAAVEKPTCTRKHVSRPTSSA